MEITVMQWNVWIEQDIEHVLDVLKANPTDVVCLQELTRAYLEGEPHQNTWEYLEKKLGYKKHVQEIPIITENEQWSQANAIFSHYPLQEKQEVWIHEPEHPEAGHDQYRGYLQVMLGGSVGPLTIANTHMSWDPHGSLEDDPELQQLLAAIGENRERYILTGDLNVNPSSYRVAEILKRLRHAGPDFARQTWPTKRHEFNGSVIPLLSQRLDYIFTSPDVTVVSSDVIHTDISDHYPIVATLRV